MEVTPIEVSSFVQEHIDRISSVGTKEQIEEELFKQFDRLDTNLLTVLNLLSRETNRKKKVPDISLKLSRKVEDVCLLYPELRKSMEVLIERTIPRD